MTFEQTHPNFQARLRKIADAHNVQVEVLYDRWRAYCAAQYDQSPLLSEFEETLKL